MEIGQIPWLLTIITAGWFWWMAKRAERSVTLWAVGGAAFGLVISTIVLGLGHAASIPFSDHERTVDQIKWTAAAVFIIGVGGWTLTSGLHRHHLVLWRIIKKGDSTPPGKV
jgi:uncharacterized membrane protein YidH (DUF202 family)